MQSILDPKFKYVPSVQTNLTKTFARIRKQQQEAAKPPLALPVVRRIGGAK